MPTQGDYTASVDELVPLTLYRFRLTDAHGNIRREAQGLEADMQAIESGWYNGDYLGMARAAGNAASGVGIALKVPLTDACITDEGNCVLPDCKAVG
jgi:hypothetical protein